MAFLRTRAVNWINLHSAIQALAQGMGGVFVLVFLLRAGVSVPASLCAMALIFAVRFTVRPAVLVAARPFGLKPLVVAGSIAIALQYPVLAEVRGLDPWLLAYCGVAALGETFYWTSYHAYFSLLGDSEHRGHQIGAGIALSAVVGIAAPLLGAFALLTAGPRPAFAAVGGVQALAALPLLATPNVRVPERAAGALRPALPGVGLFMADGWLAVSYLHVWQIALFLSLGASLSAYGGAMALAALVGAVSGLLLGRHIDAGYGRRAVAVAFSAVGATLLLRAVSFGTPWRAVGAHAAGAFASCLLAPAQMVPAYNLAKVSPCALRFHIAAEGRLGRRLRLRLSRSGGARRARRRAAGRARARAPGRRRAGPSAAPLLPAPRGVVTPGAGGGANRPTPEPSPCDGPGRWCPAGVQRGRVSSATRFRTKRHGGEAGRFALAPGACSPCRWS